MKCERSCIVCMSASSLKKRRKCNAPTILKKKTRMVGRRSDSNVDRVYSVRTLGSRSGGSVCSIDPLEKGDSPE